MNAFKNAATAIALAGGLALLAPAAASAGTASTPVSVSATVISNCTISSPAALAFGSYDPVVANASTNLDVTAGALSVACTKGDTATISFDLGANATGSTRRLKDASANYLTYEVYTTSARSTVWNATNTVSYVSAGKAASTLSVYGRIPSGQDAAMSATYADTINATINF